MAHSRKQATTGNGARKRPTLGPVERMAREAATVWHATDRLDGSDGARGAADHLDDWREAISTLASAHAPRNADGAAFLAMIAAGDADTLASSVFPQARDRQRIERRLSRCLHSVAAFLCANGASIAPAVRDALAGEHANPHAICGALVRGDGGQA